MQEIVVNLHMHTRYSDGGGTHKDIAQAAIKTGLEAVIVTDHNVLVQGVEGYYRVGRDRVLLLVGQEVHDQELVPQKNHLLAFNTNRDVSTLADDPQRLINGINDAGGLCFPAHPDDVDCPVFNETSISWEAWDVHGYTGIELWNGLSELKTALHTKLHALFYAFFPQFIARHPMLETLQRWDNLLTDGGRVVAIGGSDAHAVDMCMGLIHRVIFPYDFHFRTVNTHIFIHEPLTGDVPTDKKMIYDALAAGHCFVGYDLPASTRGFIFNARGLEQSMIMGDEISSKRGVTLQAHLPKPAEIRLIKDGKTINIWKHSQACAYSATEPGVYRVEVWRNYLGLKRGWIFSNPIYVR
jgi:hypothetical protein